MTVYALNLFNVADREEYLAYSRRSVAVEWESEAAFDSYCSDPALSDLHPHRENGSSDYIWQLFDRLDDLRPVLKLDSR
jgi:hypothetical protein